MVSPPGLAPDLSPSQSDVLLLHYGDVGSCERERVDGTLVTPTTLEHPLAFAPTNENWRPMPVMLRRDLIDNQAGCYYLNRAKKWWLVSAMLRPLVGFNDALICLSYPTIQKWLSRLVTLQRLPLIRRVLYS